MTTHIIRNKMFMKVLSLVISIMFVASNITFATPKDYSTLRQPSTAIPFNSGQTPPTVNAIAAELLTSAKSSIAVKTASAGTARIETEQLLGNMSLGEAADEARRILESRGRYLYSGDYYVAVSRTTKEDGIIEDKVSLKGRGVIVGLGDSDADLFFLGTDKLKDRIYLPFYLGGPVNNPNIIEVKKRQIDGAKQTLKLITKALREKLTYREFFAELKELVVDVKIPDNINLDDTFELDTVYADKDKTLTLPEGGQPDDEMADYVSKILENKSRFVILSSNAPEEITENFAMPVKRRLTEKYHLSGNALDEALSRLEVCYNNSLGCFHYDIAKREFVVKYEFKDVIPDIAKVMIFKIYIKTFLEYLEDAGSKTINGTRILDDARVIRELRQIYDRFNPAEVSRLMALADPSEICEAFKKLVAPYVNILGTAKGNIYIRTWADAFVTTETAKAALSLQNRFPKWVQKRTEEILKEIAEASEKLSSARKLFREGERIWRKAKDCPGRSQVEGLANQAIERFKEAKEILDTLPVKDINAKRLLQLIAGDRPKERTGGHISRAKKTVIESAKLVDLYNERGTRDKTAGRPTAQYLHADPKGLIHATVGLFIFRPDGNIVFQRRAPDKVFFPNMLTLAACGHPDRTKKGEIKDIFTATKDEAGGETGIPIIYGRRIRKIGHPDKIKGPYKYDQRVDFIAYEFVATSKEEAETLRHIGNEINGRQKSASKSIFDRLICNYNDEIWTLTLYTFGWNKKDAIEEKAKEIIQRTGIPIGDVNYNREVKSLYAYVATEEEMEIVKTKKTEHKAEEVAKFEIDTRSIEDIAKDFQNNPEKYPDTFIPTFTNPVIVKQLADLQKEIRKSAKTNIKSTSTGQARGIFDLKDYLDEIPPASESAIKMVIFDWGKVINPYDYHIPARLLAGHFGLDETLAFKFFEERNINPENPVYQYEHGQIDGKQLTDMTIEWLKQNTGKDKIELTVGEFEKIFVSIWGRSFPAVVSLITTLRKKGYKVCILSTTNDIHYRYFMENVFPLLGIEKDYVFTSHITGIPKPDLESYLQVIKHAGIEPEQALFVDDRRDCIEGAIRAGLQVRLFDQDDIEGSVKDIVGATLEGCLLQKAFDELIPPASESSIKLVIFDQGNVVTRYDYNKVAEELHRRFGIDKKVALIFCEERHSNPENPIYQYEHGKIDEEQLVAEIKQWLEDVLHRQVNLTREDWREIFNKDWLGNIPETTALIKDLKAKGYQIRGLATISRIHFEYASDPANKIGLISLLEKPEHFYASCEREYAKPDKRSYLEVAKDAGVSPAQCLLVDDIAININGAKDAGLQVCLFDPLEPLQSIVDIASYFALSRTTARSSSAGFSPGADEGTWRIAEAINKKVVHTYLVYTLPEALTVKNKKLRIVPLTPELMIKKADEFFILQNSVAADVAWTKERDVIGVAKGRKDGPIQFNPELNCSFAVLDENDAPVAVAMHSSADERKGYAYLETFAVLPEYQGTAVASWILLHSFQEARRQGLTYASWITREELDEFEKANPYQRHSVRAMPYYEIKVNARRDEKKGENGRIPPKEETGDDNVPWEVRPGKWHVAYHKDLSDLYSLYADFKAKSALCTISNRVIIAINTAA